MDVSAATSVIRQKIADKLCPNSTCNTRSRRALNLQSNGGLDLAFLFDVSDSLTDEDFGIGIKFAEELVSVLLATLR